MQPTLYTGLAKKLPTFLYKYLAKRWINYAFPRHLFIELNTTCNLSCSYCPRPQINEEMDYEVFRKIVDEASQYGKRSFSLHLFGEPLLYKRIFESINYLKEKGHTVLLTTNGTLLDKFAKQLMECGVDRIIWTWGRNALLPQTIKIIKKVLLVRVFNGQITKEEKESLKGCKFEYKELHNYGGNILSNLTLPTRYACYHLWLAPAIRYNGDFTLCCNDPNGDLVIGNIKEKSINELWNSEQVWKQRVNQLNGVYCGICHKCNVWSTYPNIM